jgi:cell wall-associated NlpC family hydrolase
VTEHEVIAATRPSPAGNPCAYWLAAEPSAEGAALYKIAAAGAAAAAVPLVLVLLAASMLAAAQAGGGGLGRRPTALAMQDIPANYLAWYTGAARECRRLPWSVLAGIGKVESNHGRSRLPGVRTGASRAGAEGPMQLQPTTFAEFAVNADPRHRLTPYDAPDAIYTAARMLCANGARSGTDAGIQHALFAYRHAASFISDVITWALRYARPAATGGAAAAINFAEAQIGKPYCWGGQGPGCFDCSGLVFAAYATAGIHLARTTFQWRQDGPQVPLSQLQPGDLLFSAGSDGTPASPGHVVMYLGSGQVIQAPMTGEDVQIDPVDLDTIVVATRPTGLITGAP